jgi:hypothetical protein
MMMEEADMEMTLVDMMPDRNKCGVQGGDLDYSGQAHNPWVYCGLSWVSAHFHRLGSGLGFGLNRATHKESLHSAMAFVVLVDRYSLVLGWQIGMDFADTAVTIALFVLEEVLVAPEHTQVIVGMSA